MAQPFSPEQRDAIRARLLESARQHIVSDGVKKTSLDMLTSDAGISKSSFYKFYDSKEQLFFDHCRRMGVTGHLLRTEGTGKRSRAKRPRASRRHGLLRL